MDTSDNKIQRLIGLTEDDLNISAEQPLIVSQTNNQDNDCISSNCYQILRMISSLIFYSTIDPINNETHKEEFMKYCNDVYPEILNDYIHIMDHHQNDISGISQTIKRDIQLMNECDVQNCMALRRHYRNRDNSLLNKPEQNEVSQDSMDFDLIFFIELLDCIHCFWYHSYHLGIRINTDDIKYENESKTEGKQYFDQQFAIRSQLIKENKTKMDKMNILKNRLENKKFTLLLQEGMT